MQQKAYYEKNRDEKLAYQKAYYEENREEIVASTVEYNRNRYSGDPTFRQVASTRRNLNRVLKGFSSHQPTLDLLGCTGQ